MTEFPLTVTASAAILLGLLYLFLTAAVIIPRRKNRVAAGDNGDPILAKRIRGHANAAEQIPLGLILIGLNEMLNGVTFALILTALLVIGRMLHAIHYTKDGTPLNYRVMGMALTLLSHLLGIIGLALGLIL